MHYYKSNNEIMQYCSFSNDIALIMHYRALLKRSGFDSSENILPLNITFFEFYFTVKGYLFDPIHTQTFYIILYKSYMQDF